MSKYAHITSRLPRMLGDSDPSYQDKVTAVKEAITQEPGFKRHASYLAQAFAAIRDEKAQLETLMKDVNLRLEAVSQLMADQFENEGVTSINLVHYRVDVRLEPYAQVVDRDALRVWCDQDPDLRRKMMLPWQTLNTLTKDRLIAGEPEPPGVTVYAQQRFTLTRKGS